MGARELGRRHAALLLSLFVLKVDQWRHSRGIPDWRRSGRWRRLRGRVYLRRAQLRLGEIKAWKSDALSVLKEAAERLFRALPRDGTVWRFDSVTAYPGPKDKRQVWYLSDNNLRDVGFYVFVVKDADGQIVGLEARNVFRPGKVLHALNDAQRSKELSYSYVGEYHEFFTGSGSHDGHPANVWEMYQSR